MKPFDPRLLRYSRSSRGFIFAIIAIAILGSLCTVTQAWLLVDLTCRVFQKKQSLHSLFHEIALLALIFLTRALLSFFNDQISARASSKMRNELRYEVMKKVLENGGEEVKNLGTAGLAMLVTKGINNLDGYFAKYLPQLFIAGVVPASVGCVIAIRDWKSGAIVFLTLPLIPIFGILIGRYTASATEKKWKTLGLLGGYFLDLLSGLTTLKVYGRAKLQAQRLRNVGDQYRKETMQVLRISFLTSLALELVATLSVALLAVTIGLRLVNGSMPLASGLFVLVLAPEVYWPIRQVSAYFHSAADGLAAFQEIFSVLQAPATQESEGISHVSEISWDALEVAFPGRALIRIPPGKIAPGELTALVGPSGSGKSTLAAVLLGFVKPTQGEVWLAQEGKKVPLSTLDIRHWRAQVSWQPQEPKFPLGTIAEILRHAQPNASDGELVTALAKVDLNITDLPDGLHTELGTLRQKSSVGQLRKIALARALLKKSSLIILDEPTASVDDISEATIAGVIQQSVKEGSMVLLISHREPLISAEASIIEIGGVL